MRLCGQEEEERWSNQLMHAVYEYEHAFFFDKEYAHTWM
jgi:hypothetical protein